MWLPQTFGIQMLGILNIMSLGLVTGVQTNATVGQYLVLDRICCPNKEKLVPSWRVNDTLYATTDLPRDYSASYVTENGCYHFKVHRVKLWMNSTTYGCYLSKIQNDGQNYTTLRVIFEFFGPTKFYQTSEDSILLSCFSPQINIFEVSVGWIINNATYSPVNLPFGMHMRNTGLEIQNIGNLKESTFQCFMYSDLLYDKNYYYSETVCLCDNCSSVSQTCENNFINIEINSIEYLHINPIEISQFKFRYSSFDFRNTSTNISWNRAGCDENSVVSYNLIKTSYNKSQDIATVIANTSLGATTEALIFDTNITNGQEIYSIAVLAYSNGILCGTTNTKLKFQLNTKFQEISYLTGEEICIKPALLHMVVTWQPDSCICSPWIQIKSCSCVTSSINKYNVHNNLTHICWTNLENETAITFALQYFEPMIIEINVNLTMEIAEVYKVVGKTVPSPPYVTSYERNLNYVLLFSDIYNGHSPILSYTANVTDNTGYMYIFPTIPVNNTSPTRSSIPWIVLSNSTVCGELIIKSQSRNALGWSLTSTHIINTDPPNENSCACFHNNVQIVLEATNTTSSTINTKVSCVTRYNSNKSDITFEVHLYQKEKYVQKRRTTCQGNFVFSELQHTTTYGAKIYWKSECPLFNVTFTATTTKQILLSRNLIISIISAAVLFVLVAVVVVITIVICYCLIKRYRCGRQTVHT